MSIYQDECVKTKCSSCCLEEASSRRLRVETGSLDRWLRDEYVNRTSGKAWDKIAFAEVRTQEDDRGEATDLKVGAGGDWK